MWKTEDEYLDMADKAAENKAPFSAVVYALMALVSVFRDLRDTLYDIRNSVSASNQVYSGYAEVAGSQAEVGQLTTIAPFCPYCAMPLDTAGSCVNVECHEAKKDGAYGSVSD